MKTISPILIISLLFYSCKQSVYQGSCNENPKYKDRLFVFIGEKISVDLLPHEEHSMDSKFKATYKVIKPICGIYDRDTIQFIVYDHYGTPDFSEYKNVMLFVTNYDDTFYHEKYQYFDVYKTKSGEWASSYKHLDYGRLDSNTDIKPERVNFLQPPSYDLKYMSKKVIQKEYPHPYYKIVGDSAVAVWGNYPDELLEVKKKGILAARKIFGDTSASSFLVQDVSLADVTPDLELSLEDSMGLIESFQKLISAVSNNDANSILSMSVKKVDCSICEGFPVYDYVNGVEPIKEFITASKLLHNSTLWEVIKSSGKYKIYTKIVKEDPENHLFNENKKLQLYTITFRAKVVFPSYTATQYHEFKFVKINKDFKFYGIETN